MRVRSLAPPSRGLHAPRVAGARSARGHRTAMVVALRVLAAALALAPGLVPSAAGAAPAAPRAVKGSLSIKTVTVTWKATKRGTVQVAVRRVLISGKRKTVTRRVLARSGKASIRVPASTPPSTLRIRARRCNGAGKRQRCSRWTRWTKPAAPATTMPANGTPGTGPADMNGDVAFTPAQNAPGTTTPITTAPGQGPTIGGCPQMPSSWALNQRVDQLPVSVNTNTWVGFIGTTAKVHPDFGAADLGAGPGGFGIPFRVVPASEPLVPITLGIYADESDPGPYPIPLDTPVEGGPDSSGDRHVLVVREGECKLYELGEAYPYADHWGASVGAIFDLTTGAARPTGWTSADAAGLPIEPLLARYDEVASGQIRHALRMTAHGITGAYVPPASHFAQSSTNPSAPPMGQRFRMKASYDTSRLTGQAKVIATAMKEYGLVLADTGSDWYVTGAPDPRWDDDDLGQLKNIPGSAFEAVDSAIIVRR